MLKYGFSLTRINPCKDKISEYCSYMRRCRSENLYFGVLYTVSYFDSYFSKSHYLLVIPENVFKNFETYKNDINRNNTHKKNIQGIHPG